MTKGDLIKIVVAALVGGTITYAIGPIVKREMDKRTYGSYWAGTWDTVSCHENGTYTFWEITLEQSGNRVAGRYKGAREETETIRGRVSGDVNLSELKGEWSAHRVQDFVGGNLSFVMVENGSAFEGTYNSGATQRIWNGRRDGAEPVCK